MQIQAVLFDLDGTLLDTAPDFILALNALRVEYELSPLPDAPIRNTVSDGARAPSDTVLRIGASGSGLNSYSTRKALSARIKSGAVSSKVPSRSNNTA